MRDPKKTKTMNSLPCPECDSEDLVAQNVSITGERYGEKFTVTVPGFLCAKCRFTTIDSSQSGKFTQAVSDAYRKVHGLLTTADFKRLRHERNMSQVEFAAFIPVGIATLKRWELGQIQERAMDELVRLKTDPEAALRNAHELNPDVIFDCRDNQIYTRPTNISIDLSSLEQSDILEGVDEPVAA